MTLPDRTEQLVALHARVFGPVKHHEVGSPPESGAVFDDDQLLARIRGSKQGEKFRKLFDDGDTSGHKGNHSVADLALCCILAFWTRKNRDQMERLFGQSKLGKREKWTERSDYRKKTIDEACEKVQDVYEPLALILDPGDPLHSAREFVARHLMVDRVRAVQHQQDVFYQFDPETSAYRESDEASMRAALYRFLERARSWGDDGLEAFRPTKTKIESVLDALRAVCHLPAEHAAPRWLVAPQDAMDPLDLLACRNGLLHIPTRTLHPSTPNFFTLNGVDVAFDPQAPAPVEWLKFLKSVWSDDQESIDTLQELLGYFLIPDTRFQKIGMVIGPKRSGKGTIGKIARALVGRRNTCNPTLASFGRDFGKQVLIDKTLAIIPDARLSGRTDPAMIAETLLSISGDDPQTIPRKFQSDWNGQLPTRFLLLSNELPKIGDASGALASRFILLVMQQSFFGKEDLGLFSRLATELPGILNWALTGRDRLYKRGYFVQPKSAKQMLQEFEDLNSPISVFLRERCKRTTGETETGALFQAWQQFCHEHGIDHPGTTQTFGRNLRAAVPGITDCQHRVEGGTVKRFWKSLVLVDEASVDEPKDLPF